jgi:uncharacterized protein YwgA
MEIKATPSNITLLLIKKATENKDAKKPGVLGRKSLQKSLYFLNQHHDTFHFRWGDYGPLCEYVQQIAVDLKARGQINMEEIPTEKQGAKIQNMIFLPKRNDDFSDIKFPPDLERYVEKVIQFLTNRDPRELELLSSVHCLAKCRQLYDGEKYTADYIYKTLTKLKSDECFTLKEIQYAITTLESNGYLP